MVVMLRQCCCGCTLKTGTLIIGVLDAIAAAGYLISGIIAASAASTIGDIYKANWDTIIILGIVTAVFAALLLLVAICLIVGAANSNPVLLMPWMGYCVIFIVANTVLSIVYSVQYFAMGNATNGTGNIIGAIIYLLIQTYFFLVVYSLFRELKGTAPPNSA